MTGLIDWASARARMIIAIIALSLAAGVYAYTGLPKEGEPDIEIPALFISVPFPGISAEDSESLLIRTMETELADLDGLKKMNATASENYAGIALEFEFGWDKTKIMADVRDAMNKAETKFPAGVFNLVNGDGSGVGTDMSSHPDIDMMSFTGSTRAGRLISKNSAETIKRVCLELGGKGGNIVFADSYKNAVRDGIRNVMSNSGQSCDAPTRMLVEKSIYERAIKEAADEANLIKVDHASKKGDHIGPVVSKTQYDKIINLIQSGIDEGATLAAGGPDLPHGLNKGYFIKPTIFTDVKNDMRIAKEEIFGPVLSIIPFETEEEAIKIVNETEYGLGNYLQTEDKEKAKRVARKVRAGTVYINGQATDTGMPFGGYKQSGNGREGGVWGFTEFLEVKAITGWN